MNVSKRVGGWNERARDYWGGALMLLLGIAAMVQGSTYRIGSLAQMEAGFFPVALGAILALLGFAIVCRAGRARAVSSNAQPQAVDCRGPLCILLGMASFVVVGTWGGLLPATFALVFISALGDRQSRVKHVLMLAALICTICVVVFWWALQLQFPLFSWG
ncbi:Tripartite tricarboxylate transporter TctB family protein [Caballeronia udeis]|uniref:Tripartite tricarboxylate transporter TctB family protein n=1 Tax=Caballeronia udeis TaxID=1232866 RepID=A0A158JJJ4_9BURK|nr:tripartite tricarboxylate transporter TctB family protein [Caballeronia udeis]SAL68633.1 Tripartite tricarboxylate transporter TctB family protein [Caballeronia udeis]